MDHATNARIARLAARCPEVACDYEDELWRMTLHLQACRWRQARCPFAGVGCTAFGSGLSSVDAGTGATTTMEHLRSHDEAHRSLLENCIDNLRNEIGSMRAEMGRLKEEDGRLEVGF